MSQYLLINHIKVQNANAIAGFTWGFPAITHFLGFSHNLARKLADTDSFNDISLTGCAVVAHEYHVHTYRSSYDFEFTQSRNPPYLSSHAQVATPPVIEEGKMNMTVSLLVGCEGNIGNRTDSLRTWLKKVCMLQRLAGGTILDIRNVEVFKLDEEKTIRAIKRKLLPGFVLMDRSNYLDKHYQTLLQKNSDAELLNAWLDFTSLKQQARPKSNQINSHLHTLANKADNQQHRQLIDVWEEHLKEPYQEGCAPEEIKKYFDELEDNKTNKKLLEQLRDYCAPTEETDADWEYVTKPEAGYLVPVMTGYKAISKVYESSEVENTRDNETDVCFVEPVHSIGEWRSVHRLKTAEDLRNCLWHYHYKDHWYLCQQNQPRLDKGITKTNEITIENPDDDF